MRGILQFTYHRITDCLSWGNLPCKRQSAVPFALIRRIDDHRQHRIRWAHSDCNIPPGNGSAALSAPSVYQKCSVPLCNLLSKHTESHNQIVFCVFCIATVYAAHAIRKIPEWRLAPPEHRTSASIAFAGFAVRLIRQNTVKALRIRNGHFSQLTYVLWAAVAGDLKASSYFQ